MHIKTVIFSIIFAILAFSSGALFFLVNYPVIDLEQQRITAHALPTIVLDDAGNEWTRFQLDRREPIPLKRIPQNLINAFLAAEDHTFFQHNGISWRGIIRSMITNLSHGRIVQGASTITQQLVKLTFLSNEKTVMRKIKEQFMALILEYRYAKEQILEAYLNTVYFGAGIYGVQAAAQRFWHKNIEQLSLAECALLASIVRSPGNYCPLATKNQQHCLQRRNLVLKLMQQHAYITTQEYQNSSDQPLNICLETETLAPHARELIRNFVEAIVGRERLYAGGLEIKTTLNLTMQKNAEHFFKKQIITLRKQLPVDGACTVVDLQTNAIKVLVGGFSFIESQFNRATQARRQMGSIFKPVVYAAALHQGKTLADIEIDEPLTQVKDWNPHNVHRRFEGPMTLARALATSNNIIAIKTFLHVGSSAVINLAQNCHLPGPFVPYPALALGCTECSLLQATSLYSTIARQGVYQEPYIIEWVKDRWGKKIWKHEAESEQALPPRVCGQLIQALKLVPTYLAQRLQIPWLNDAGIESIGKTGMTNQARTCWFIGATPSYVTGIYLGCDDNSPLLGYVSSTRTVAPLWLAINKTINHPITTFCMDANLKMATVDARTGWPVRPHDSRAINLLI